MFDRTRIEREVRAELDFHLEMKKRELVGRGLEEADAESVALSDFGDRERIEAACRHIRGGLGFRTLTERLRPLATVALGTVGLVGLGLLMDATWWRPAADAHEGGLVEIRSVFDQTGVIGVSVEDFTDWRAEGVFEQAALARRDTVAIGAPGGAATIDILSFTTGYLDLAGASFALRSTDEGWPERSVVLAHSLWLDRFGGHPDILGRSVSLNGVPHEVVAVTDAAPVRWTADAFVPVGLQGLPRGRSRRGNHAIARLAPGLDIGAAQRRLDAIAADLADAHPRSNLYWTARILPVGEGDVDRLRTAWFLGLSCGLGLLLAALSGASRREHSFLGALHLDAAATAQSVWRHALLRRVLPVATAVLVAGLVAATGVRLLLESTLGGVAHLYPVRIDGVGATLAVISVAAVVLLTTDRSQSMARASRFVGLATGLALTIVGAHFLRAAMPADSDRLGFEPDAFVTAHIELPGDTYPTADERGRFFTGLLGDVAAELGETNVALSQTIPTRSGVLHTALTVEGIGYDPRWKSHGADRVITSAGYFHLMGYDVVAGRDFAPADGPDSEPVAIVNRNAARHFWPSGGAIGSGIRVAGNGPYRRVVGIVENIPERGTDASSRTVYLPVGQEGPDKAFVIVRSAASEDAAEAIERAVYNADAGVPTDRIETAAQHIRAPLTATRRLGWLCVVIGLVVSAFSAFGVIAAVLGRVRDPGGRGGAGTGPYRPVTPSGTRRPTTSPT